MKNIKFMINRFRAGCLLLMIFMFSSCEEINIPAEMIGSWESETIPVTVRTHSLKTGFVFTSDTAVIKFTINSDNTASGSIGSAQFVNAVIMKNGGNPDITGVAYNIECGSVGKIFENDPLDEKVVELWLGPVKDNTIDAELRYTQGLAYFPMASAIYSRVD
ncbi:MAG: hypothetical protein V1903_06250 [Bacteroidota bacterium]